MKILIVSEDIPNPHLGGLGKHALALAHELHRTGHTVDVLGNADHPIDATPEQRGPGQFFGAISGHQRGWKQQALGAYHPWANRWNAGALAKAIVAHAPGYDVVHYHGHLPWVAHQLPASLPFTQTRHDQGGDCMLRTRFRPEAVRCESRQSQDCATCATPRPNGLQRALSAWSVRDMRRSTAEAFDARPVIFVSEFLRQAFSKVSGTQPQGEVIHHGIDLVALERALSALSPSSGERWPIEIFTAGAVFPYKGFGAFLAELQKQGLPAGSRVTLAGDGPELPALRARFKSDRIRFLGWCDYATVLGFNAHADVVVVPSLWEEAFGSTTLEALALGRTVYALRQGGTPELSMYAGEGASRLRLFDSMSALVTALRAHPHGSLPAGDIDLRAFTGSTARMAEKVLAHYAAQFGLR